MKDEGIITPPINEDKLQYIVSLRAIPAEAKDEVDFISDEQLIAYFAKLKFGKKTILSKKEAEKLKNSIAEYTKKGELKKEHRVTRLKEILDKYLEADSGGELVNDYLNSEKGIQFLDRYVESKPDILTKATGEIENAIKAQEDRLRQVQNDVQSQIRVQRERVDDEKIKATKSIEEIRKKSEEDLKREQQEALGDLKSNIIELELKKEQLNKAIEKFYTEQEDIKKFEDMRNKTNYLSQHQKELEKAVSGLKHFLSNPDLGVKITEVKTVIDMLQGRSLDQRDEKYEFEAPAITEIKPDHANQYIQTLVEFFENDGHSISFEEIANLLINIQQSFLTVLAGLPGSGKTSSITRLSIAQGLCPQEQSHSDCFLNVPVARGWVSSRDFVGFNNSLKGMFQPAKTGVYQFLRQSEQEQPEADHVLRMILLDEANLSPIEHYWSEFLAMCDKEGRHRPLDTGIQGDKRYLKVAENIRFIATINNDNTTEPLSPRLCDRVPVITMMNAPDIESVEHVASLSLKGAIPYSLLDEWFGVTQDSNQEEPSLIREFCEKMSAINNDLGVEIHISQRKLNAMTAYYTIASKYISQFVAIDFALSQHVLPLISGHGKEFRTRLEDLEELAKNRNLKRTSALLRNMLKADQTYIDSYSFF